MTNQLTKNRGKLSKSNHLLNSIKPFDIININKFKPGKGNKSTILKDLVQNKNVNSNNVQTTIKNKIEEIQERIKKFETMAMNLGKDFTSSYNK
jgi:hypothetical protein